MFRALRPAAAVLALVLGAAPALPGPGPAPTFVDVAVATVWTSPGSPRAVDRPALANPVDVPAWLDAMSVADKLDLTGANRTQTQALYGRPVVVLERRDGWAEVAVPGQPTPKSAAGYPGWVPESQLTDAPGFAALAASRPTAVVDRAATTWLHSDPLLTGRDVEISADTRLPVLGERPGAVLVATPSDGVRWVAADAVTVRPLGEAAPAARGDALVRAARLFLGRPYLWGGRAGFGLDCSGFTGMLHGMHGITIPRDAFAQARSGRPVVPDRLQPGDLLFYAHDGGRGAVHHVAMYVGDGQMAEASDAATPIRITPVRRGGEFSGARRYLP